MKLEDIKVGDVVTTKHIKYEGDYTVEDIRESLIILDVRHRTTSYWNTPLKNTLWAVKFTHIVKVVDPEEDLIVWGALEVGEHFKWNREDSKECVKIAPRAYAVLGHAGTYFFNVSNATKVKLI